MSENDKVLFEVNGNAATITINRPDCLNALDAETIHALYRHAITVGSDPKIRVVLITGAGRAFCAGGDVKDMLGQALANPNKSPAVIAKETAGILHALIAELRRMPKPVVTAVNGPCAGAGVGIALAGDIVWANESASFNLAYTRIGLSPDGGTTYLLPRAVGEKMAMELFLTSRKVESSEAVKIGLVTRVLPDDEFKMTVADLVGKLAVGPTKSYAEAKQLVTRSLREGLETQMEMETQGVARTVISEDFMEGVSAFSAKRAPEFHGK
ncbi:MAG: enoyl-CoA hydratase-related protein [Planctomycetota bacterium]|nr:enoyl-CoA hydratase-related protein [Planctomycetota bacterium]